MLVCVHACAHVHVLHAWPATSSLYEGCCKITKEIDMGSSLLETCEVWPRKVGASSFVSREHIEGENQGSRGPVLDKSNRLRVCLSWVSVA